MSISSTAHNLERRTKNPKLRARFINNGVSRIRSLKGKTLDEIYGSEKADKIRTKLKIASSGSRNGMFGKPSPKGAGKSSCSGYLDGVYFRSFSELSFLVAYPGAESAENVLIQYLLDGKERTYRPDFIVDSFIFEVKPEALTKTRINQIKFQAALAIMPSFAVVCPRLHFDLIPDQLVQDLENSGRLQFTRIDRSKVSFSTSTVVLQATASSS